MMRKGRRVGDTDLKSLPDEALVVASCVGHLTAFEELARRYRPAMLAVAERLVGTHDIAEDVVQESLFIAYKALPQLRKPGRFGARLHAITRHRSLRMSQRDMQWEPLSDLDAVLWNTGVGLVATPEQIALRRETHHHLHVAMKRLPDEYQIPLQLHYWEEMPQDRIAAFLDLPLTTIKWRLHKGKRLLRERLEPMRRS